MRECFKYIIGLFMCMFLYADCEDFLTEADCEASDHCEWHEHGDESVCEDSHGDEDCEDTDHFDTDGLSLESHGTEIYSQFQGLIEGSVEVHMNEAEDISIHFLDGDGNEIEVTDVDCYPLSFDIADPSIISIEIEGDHDDHDDHDHDDEHGSFSFEIEGQSIGSTTFTISIMHQGHADYTSMPILVTVEEEVHCDELTESDCEASDHC